MFPSRIRKLRAIGGLAPAALLSAFLAGCLQSEPKSPEKAAADNPTRQISAQLQKPYLLNEQGEIITQIPPQVLEAMKEDQRKQANLSAVATLEEMYDPVTGNLRDAPRAQAIQHEADSVGQVLAKRGAP